MANQNPNAVAVCGLYCGACFRWQTCHDRDDNFTPRDGEAAAPWNCNGCRSDHVGPACAKCQIRDCAYARGLTSCADCGEMPCAKIEAFAAAPLPHAKSLIEDLKGIKQSSERAWADAQRDRWTCAHCGAHTHWYEETCQSCGKSVLGFSPKGTIWDTVLATRPRE